MNQRKLTSNPIPVNLCDAMAKRLTDLGGGMRAYETPGDTTDRN